MVGVQGQSTSNITEAAPGIDRLNFSFLPIAQYQ